MKKRYMILGCAAAALIASTSIGGAWSYFTTYAEVAGSKTVSLGDVTDITEDFSSWNKAVTITSDAGSQPVYVRAKAIAGTKFQDYITYSSTGSWTTTPDREGFVYFTQPVVATDDVEGKADVLNVSIKGISDTELAEKNLAFNVVVVFESAPVGDAQDYTQVDWDETVDTGTAATSTDEGGE